jgi:hypothetical protein
LTLIHHNDLDWEWEAILGWASCHEALLSLLGLDLWVWSCPASWVHCHRLVLHIILLSLMPMLELFPPALCPQCLDFWVKMESVRQCNHNLWLKVHKFLNRSELHLPMVNGLGHRYVYLYVNSMVVYIINITPTSNNNILLQNACSGIFNIVNTYFCSEPTYQESSSYFSLVKIRLGSCWVSILEI